MQVQFFLVLPLLALSLFSLVYWIISDTSERVKNSTDYLLQSTANSFDEIFKTSKKLLETPYTDKTIYSAITTVYEPADYIQKTADTQNVSFALTSVLYYAPEVSSVVLVSEKSDTISYKRVPPTTSPNYVYEAWTNPTDSTWYKAAMATDSPVIEAGIPTELYRNSGVTILFSQRIRDVLRGENIGAIRIDLSVSNIAKSWQSILSSPQDIFLVLDDNQRLIYSSSEDFLQTNPLLEPYDLKIVPKGYLNNHFKASASGYQFIYLTHRHEIFRQSMVLYSLVFLLGLFYLGISSLYILWSSRRLSHPIHQLKAAMVKGQQKDLTVRCEPLDGEMGVLSESFNSLMDTINTLVWEAKNNEREKSKLAYEVLQSKVSPHFLYNTLNAIRWKADLLGAKEISHALESLASLLQFSIKCSDDLIPFETELTQLENYLCIMRVRYGDEIEINFDIDEACYQYQCLKFLIQPAVENCYLHAFGTQDTQKLITIRIKCLETTILVSIEDSGNGMSDEQIALLLNHNHTHDKKLFNGIGISNVRQRLKASFGEQYDLKIESVCGKYTRITAEIPKCPLKGEIS
ncbi:MAG: histidine kinase [Ruthenibacterium sp.]